MQLSSIQKQKMWPIMINDASAVINNKKYSIILNKERNNRIELIVE
jgi:hypothetical protein